MKNLTKKASWAMTIAAILTVLGSVICSLILRVDVFNLIVNIIVGLFVYAKFRTVMMFTQGWRVFNIKTIFGMPRSLFIYYIVVGVILIRIFLAGLEMHSILELTSSSKNILSFVTSFFSAVITTFWMWYAGVGEWMAKGSEYDARVQFKNNNDSDEVIEQKIVELKSSSVL